MSVGGVVGRPVAQSAARRRLTKFVGGGGFGIDEENFMGRETSFRRVRSLNVLYMEGSAAAGVLFGDDMGTY